MNSTSPNKSHHIASHSPSSYLSKPHHSAFLDTSFDQARVSLTQERKIRERRAAVSIQRRVRGWLARRRGRRDWTLHAMVQRFRQRLAWSFGQLQLTTQRVDLCRRLVESGVFTQEQAKQLSMVSFSQFESLCISKLKDDYTFSNEFSRFETMNLSRFNFMETQLPPTITADLPLYLFSKEQLAMRVYELIFQVSAQNQQLRKELELRDDLECSNEAATHYIKTLLQRLV